MRGDQTAECLLHAPGSGVATLVGGPMPLIFSMLALTGRIVLLILGSDTVLR